MYTKWLQIYKPCANAQYKYKIEYIICMMMIYNDETLVQLILNSILILKPPLCYVDVQVQQKVHAITKHNREERRNDSDANMQMQLQCMLMLSAKT